MTALADLVQYEREHELPLKHPKTGLDVGVTFWVRHIDCAAVDSVRDHQAARAILRESRQTEAEKLTEQLAACIVRWDWGDHEFEAGKGDLPLTPENALMVVTRAKWIGAQVMTAVYNIGNFTSD